MIDREAGSISYRIRKNKGKCAVAAVVLIASAAAAVYVGRFYTGWISIPDTEYRYFIENGDLKECSWVLREGAEYLHTDESAKMQTGLQQIDGSLYYFGADGVMQTGWKDFIWGRMRFGSDGKAKTDWYAEKGKKYLFSKAGVMRRGWASVSGKTYYLNNDGTMQTGWKKIGGENYCFSEDGEMLTGWQLLNDNWYLFSDRGSMLTGEQTVNGNLYFMKEDGRMLTGWRDSEKGKIYHVGSGEAAKGWTETEDGRFYFSEAHIMQTGETEIGDETFFFEEDGTVSPGWHEAEDDGGDDFFVCYDGAVLDTDKETGSYGRLVIRSCGIDVAVNEGKERRKYQDIVNEEDSAVAVKERRDEETVIADRRSQGFELDSAEEGTIAYLITPKKDVKEYLCVKAVIGVNKDGDVLDDDGKSVWKENEGGFGTYSRTDSEDPEEVRIAYWQPAEE